LETYLMSAAPTVPPFIDEAADVVIPSDSNQQIHLVANGSDHPAARVLSESSRWVGSASRRCFDCAVATMGLLAAAPMMAVTALLVRATSPGPVLFRQTRAGRYRQAFTLYKFRSMRIGGDPGPSLTVDGDPRITPLGAFLRRYKLDELPQLWNVLRGDLSLVGPRPKLPHLEALDLPYRPGLTGIATLAFRNEEKILSEVRACHVDSFYESCIKPRKAQLDQQYMSNATPWSDLTLLCRTALSCLLRSDSFSENETRTLAALAAAWPDAPPQPSEDGLSEVDYLASYFAKVELHGAQWPADYRNLDKALKRHGFSNFIQGDSSPHRLPAALYFSVNRADDLRAIAQLVKRCADRTGFRNNVLVIKSAGSRFYSTGASGGQAA
jgi:lipopolysaccharide/colanic/teichoic acid biosynthesis glycosyltransferase